MSGLGSIGARPSQAGEIELVSSSNFVGRVRDSIRARFNFGGISVENVTTNASLPDQQSKSRVALVNEHKVNQEKWSTQFKSFASQKMEAIGEKFDSMCSAVTNSAAAKSIGNAYTAARKKFGEVSDSFTGATKGRMEAAAAKKAAVMEKAEERFNTAYGRGDAEYKIKETYQRLNDAIKTNPLLKPFKELMLHVSAETGKIPASSTMKLADAKKTEASIGRRIDELLNNSSILNEGDASKAAKLYSDCRSSCNLAIETSEGSISPLSDF